LNPEFDESQSIEILSDIVTESNDDEFVLEGGPLDGLQCGEKMWIIFDIKCEPYFDLQFAIIDDNNISIKHTKTQLEDGRWHIEFTPNTPGIFLIERCFYNNEDQMIRSQVIHRINAIDTNSNRIVYGYKLYNIDDSIQIVFDAINNNVNDIVAQIKDVTNNRIVNELESNYLSDYLALKFRPKNVGNYEVNFLNKLTKMETVAASPYKITVQQNAKEIIKSYGVYDLTRLTICASNFSENYQLNEFNVIVHDSFDRVVENCYFLTRFGDLIIEFITRLEGTHKIYLFLNDILIDDNPFLIFVNGDTILNNTHSGIFAIAELKNHINNNNNIQIKQKKKNNSQQTISSDFSDLTTTTTGTTKSRNDEFLIKSDNIVNNQSSTSTSKCSSRASSKNNLTTQIMGHEVIQTAATDKPFHYIIKNKDVHSLSIYGIEFCSNLK
jgi:hypothetical protein